MRLTTYLVVAATACGAAMAVVSDKDFADVKQKLTEMNSLLRKVNVAANQMEWTIESQKNTSIEMKQTIADQKKDISQMKWTIEAQKKTAAQLKKTVDTQKKAASDLKRIVDTEKKTSAGMRILINNQKKASADQKTALDIQARASTQMKKTIEAQKKFAMDLKKTVYTEKEASAALKRQIEVLKNTTIAFQKNIDALRNSGNVLKNTINSEKGTTAGLKRQLGAQKNVTAALQKKVEAQRKYAIEMRRVVDSQRGAAAALKIKVEKNKNTTVALRKTIDAQRITAGELKKSIDQQAKTSTAMRKIIDGQTKKSDQLKVTIDTEKKVAKETREIINDQKKTIETQRNVVTALARQVSQQQLHVEETARSYGDSGLKITRLTRTGSKSYFSTTFSDQRVAAIHEHSNYKNVIGMGELLAVLNGVEFRTRHNDYKLRMPARNSTAYGATEDIPYPEVPPQVLAKPTLALQIQEMREWFKAWQNSDYSKRDYRKYFKANLCYLEGQWTNSKKGEIDEPFASDRHAIDAKSFFDLQAKIRYTSVTGRKSTKENYAYLPTTISNVDEHGNVAYAQWNYRILCHPLKRHVPLTRFRLEDDLAPRVANGKTFEDHYKQRAARFSLYEDIRDTASPSTKESYVRDQTGKFLDLLMSEIPGRDNYPAKVIDDAFGEVAYKYNAKIIDKPEPLNAGYYHNTYKINRPDAMGSSISRRGFSDANLYVAYNSQPKVSATKVKGRCTWKPCPAHQQKEGQKIKNCRTCPEYSHRVSYAIPLEIIYTTPLQTWNPYNLEYFPGKTDRLKPAKEKMVNGTSRNGGLTKEMAYYGASDTFYSFTPEVFYDKLVGGKADPADTVRRNAFGVLDKAGNVRRVMTSGIGIFTKDIPGVGAMRLRHPIMPIHDFGNVLHKELNALADMTLKKHKYAKLYPDMRQTDNGTIEEIYVFETKMSKKSPPDIHLHSFEVTTSDIETMKAGKFVKITTSTNSGHSHEIEVHYNKQWNILGIRRCDGQWSKCWDGHDGKLSCPDCRGGHPVAS